MLTAWSNRKDHKNGETCDDAYDVGAAAGDDDGDGNDNDYYYDY